MPLQVITPAPEHTVTTPNATMTRLATPSLGTSALSTWRVTMDPGASGPTHTVDHEQVWTVTTGTLTITTGTHTDTVTTGQTAVLPAGLERRVHAGTDGAHALVAMHSDGQVSTPGQTPRPLPWAA